jgi:methionyl-tRNA formyltransferase
MGTPELACASLKALLESAQFEVCAVVTQPDRPKGRDLKLTPPPVKQLALARHIPVLQPERARNEELLVRLRELRPELIAVAAYGQILPASLLELPRFGCVNVHTSLLPRYRGAAPIQWAILNGDPETGVTIMKMDAGLDTGHILAAARTRIEETDDAQTLHDRLAILGSELLVQTIPGYVSGNIQPKPQPAEGVTYARKITKEDGLIDWIQPATAVWNRVRGLVPWPVAFTRTQSDKVISLKIWQAHIVDGSAIPGTIISAGKQGLVVACGEKALKIQSLQREGGRRLNAGEFLAGCPLPPGQKLG